jgi:hypothetical protein
MGEGETARVLTESSRSPHGVLTEGSATTRSGAVTPVGATATTFVATLISFTLMSAMMMLAVSEETVPETQEMSLSGGLISEPSSNVTALDAPRGPQLDTVAAVRREMSKVYRLARRGKIRPEVGTRLAFILTSILRALELEVIEQRVERIQQMLKDEKL